MKTPSACRNLDDVRLAVNTIDREILRLLGKRNRYAQAALRFKTDRSMIGQTSHRRTLYAQRRDWAATEKVSVPLVERIFRAIFAESKRMHLAGFRSRGK